MRSAWRPRICHHLLGDLVVLATVHAQEDPLRAETHRLRGGHGGVHPELACFVGGGRNDAPPLRRSPDDDGPPAQLRSVALLDRGEEGVHINMQDQARGHGLGSRV